MELILYPCTFWAAVSLPLLFLIASDLLTEISTGIHETLLHSIWYNDITLFVLISSDITLEIFRVLSVF